MRDIMMVLEEGSTWRTTEEFDDHMERNLIMIPHEVFIGFDEIMR